MTSNSYYIAFIYGSPSIPERQHVWNTLTFIVEEHRGQWILIDDFNQVENKEQKLLGSELIRGAKGFLCWKLHNKILDIPFHGVNYTWTNNITNHEAIYERIDKAFCNEAWKCKFPDAALWNLPILLSDHSPLILQLHPTQTQKKARPYRLEAWCLEHEDVKNIIKQEWGSTSVHSSSKESSKTR